MNGWARHPLTRTAYVLVAAGIGATIAMRSARCCTSPWWVLWASTAVVFAATSGTVFGYGLDRLHEIASLRPIRRGRVTGYVLAVLIVGVSLLVAGSVLSEGPWLLGQLLLVLAGLCAVPVLAGFAAIRDHARADGSIGERAERVLELRRQLSGLLSAAGALIATATLATGAALRDGAASSTAIVLVFGGSGSLLVVLAYAPSAAACRRAAQNLCRETVPLVEATAESLPALMQERRQLEQALGLDRGLFTDLQASLVVLAPLLASAVAVFLPA